MRLPAGLRRDRLSRLPGPGRANFAPMPTSTLAIKRAPFIRAGRGRSGACRNATVYFQVLKNPRFPGNCHILRGERVDTVMACAARTASHWPAQDGWNLAGHHPMSWRPPPLPLWSQRRPRNSDALTRSRSWAVFNDWPSWRSTVTCFTIRSCLPAGASARGVLGDSITEGWGQKGTATSLDRAAIFPGKQYINRGISGQTNPQMLVRFRQDRSSS